MNTLSGNGLAIGQSLRPNYRMTIRQGDGGSPYTAPPKENTGPFVPAPKRELAGTPNFPGGGKTTTSGAFVNLYGDAFYLINGELIKDGGYNPRRHGELIPGGGPDSLDRVMRNEDMKIAQGPELGGTGRLLTIGEYNQAVDTGFNNLMNSDMTQKDFEDYLRIKETAKRQMLDGV